MIRLFCLVLVYILHSIPRELFQRHCFTKMKQQLTRRSLSKSQRSCLYARKQSSKLFKVCIVLQKRNLIPRILQFMEILFVSESTFVVQHLSSVCPLSYNNKSNAWFATKATQLIKYYCLLGENRQ